MERMILWDADGVLFQTFTPDGQFHWSQTIKDDLGLSGATLRQLFTKEWEAVLRGKVEAEERIAEVFRKHNVSVPIGIFIDYWLEKDSMINEGVARYLSLYPSCIATNQAQVRAKHFPAWFAGRVSRVFASCDIGAMKPEPAYYAHIESALGLAPERLCLIDDTKANIEAAIARGWQGHHFTNVPALATFLENLKPAFAEP